jgi:hypothetical protein
VSWVVEEGDAVVPIGWRITKARLVNKNTGVVYWNWLPTGTEFYGIEEEIEIPDTVPNHIAACSLELETLALLPPPVPGVDFEGETKRSLRGGPDVMFQNPPGGGMGGGGETSSVDVYVVLAAPTGVQNPAWDTVISWAAFNASNASDEATAKDLLTRRMFDQFSYEPRSTSWWTSTSGSNETFYARMFFQQKKGQCTDFADGLSTAACSLGISSLQPYRSYPNAGQATRIKTKTVDPAGTTQPRAYWFYFHQFTLSNSNVWDSAVQVNFTGFYDWVTNKTQAVYEDKLVEYYWDDTVVVNLAWDSGETQYFPGGSTPLSPTLVNLTLSAESP